MLTRMPSWVQGLSASVLVAILFIVGRWMLRPLASLLDSPKLRHFFNVCQPLCPRCERAYRLKMERRNHMRMIRELREKRLRLVQGERRG